MLNSVQTPQAEAMLDRGIFRMEDYVEGGWLNGLKYEDEILKDLEKRTDSKENQLKAVRMGHILLQRAARLLAALSIMS